MFKGLTIPEQVAAHLRQELKSGRWSEYMPGRDFLARELGVNGSTIERALLQLERENLLKSGGAGRRRRILVENQPLKVNQVCILLFEPEDAFDKYIIELRLQLQHAGYSVIVATKTLNELKHDPKKVAGILSRNPADAYILMAAARPVLEYFSKTSLPVFALFGRMTGLPIAGTAPDKAPALKEAIYELHQLGHKRIVFLSREAKSENHGFLERVFFEELEKLGLSHSSYNLPVWEDSPEGLEQCLESLFKVTPPSVIFVDDWLLVLAIHNYLMHKRGIAFRQLVCVCTDFHPIFHWCRPRISHFYWDSEAVVRSVLRWVNCIVQGKDDKKQQLIVSKFVSSEELI
ncbi:MAG: DNA-binding LacI/PurR family transcriptional regulator [Cryomorphaceae bacterium]|jgi:DNA-binding LacI/PurR family transcriptional regulator